MITKKYLQINDNVKQKCLTLIRICFIICEVVMFEKKLRLVDLYDFYGNMLTEKQNEIMNLYCNMDLSLGEISENLSISRQAVHDTIKRTDKALEKIEAQLGLYDRFMKRQEDFAEILKLIKSLRETKNESYLEQIEQIALKQIE